MIVYSFKSCDLYSDDIGECLEYALFDCLNKVGHFMRFYSASFIILILSGLNVSGAVKVGLKGDLKFSSC